MKKVGDMFESDVAIYKILKETNCKFYIERTNKYNHPFAPNKKWVNQVWKNCFYTDKLKKIR